MHIAVLLLLSNFFFWPSPIDWQMTQENVAIRGAVVDEESGRSIAGAVVYAMSDAYVQRTVSNSAGHFFFLTLLPGVYRLCASKSGYAADCYPRGSYPEELYAGFEYGATVVLSHAPD
jgi:Carboxypeptidase regulatory-like domain